MDSRCDDDDNVLIYISLTCGHLRTNRLTKLKYRTVVHDSLTVQWVSCVDNVTWDPGWP